ncbi:transketolase [Geosporobacter ferrireducens]|uniref:transketolase n=1 Tax=Geosporobacter ferrireducens TaxID=1424294 RepID=UPI00139CD8C4|nr:transketolase [Geosporobacter ferrireducens]MTI56083.1 transketolase [Geosporobacter ferrireducens]
MNAIEEKAINTMRFLAADAVEKAKSGHPGMPMGAAPMAYILWRDFLKHSPTNPKWHDRDRFILSAGHGSMLLYSLLHLYGYDISLDDIKNFRQWGSKTPGHPEVHHTPGVETTTGPLGQGFSNGVGMAMAEAILAAHFNTEDITLIDHFTYVIAGDGDMMEGIASEAASLAGHLQLGKLICLYDDNKISIDGSTELAFGEDVGKRFEAYGWHVQKVEDGNDLGKIHEAIKMAKSKTHQPSLIRVRNQIGYGSPNKAGTAGVHGEPLGTEELKLAKAYLHWPIEPAFYVPEDVREHFLKQAEQGEKLEAAWQEKWEEYEEKYPDLAKKWKQWHQKKLDEETLHMDDLWSFGDKPVATRNASGEVLNRLAGVIENLIGGSADLSPSNKTYLKGLGDFSATNRVGRNIRFGVREHAMGAILNGLVLHGGIRPYGATFLIFSDYLRPAIRLSALMKLPVIYVFTHDSISVGEDGPTHQPIEQLAALRAIPDLTVIRPADAKETVSAWQQALENNEGPTALILSRQNLPVLEQTGSACRKGGYILKGEKEDKPDILLMASGSEVSLLIDAHGVLENQGIHARVISMPSLEIFQQQEQAYIDQVLPPDVKARLAVEAALPMGWERYVGDQGKVIGINEFGASAPGELIMKKYGFTVEAVVESALGLLKK